LKVTLLGTGTSQGVPVIGCDCEVCTSLDFRDKRFRASIHIEVDGLSLVVDTGPDFRMQMLQAGIKKLDAVLMTHEHKDHTAGLDDIRPFNFLQKKDMPVFGKPNVLEQIKREFAYIFSGNRYPGIPQVEAVEIGDSKFVVEGVQITPIPVMHYKLPVLGFRIKDFTYITDANYISEESLALIEGTDTLILNALQKEAHISHFTLAEAVEMAKKIGARKTYFTHISHRLGLHSKVESELPEGIALGYDNQVIILP
jgi:phosphoribosyl 1,2-cyclic phosphate phosphodiesterase